MKKFIAVLVCSIFLFGSLAYSQKESHRVELKWNGSKAFNGEGRKGERYLHFDGAINDPSENYFPIYFHQLKINGRPEKISATVNNPVFEPFSKEELKNIYKIEEIKGDVKIETHIGFDRREAVGLIYLMPIRFNSSTGVLEKLLSCDLEINYSGSLKSASSSKSYAPSSVLETGDWYKIGVTKDGIYKIDFNFLKAAGVDPSEIDPRNIKIFGNGGGMMPIANSSPRNDDLTENAIFISGETDGKFDSTDFILFYGQDPVRWQLDQNNNFVHRLHYYSDTTFYFLNFSSGQGKRTGSRNSITDPPTHIVSSFDDYAFHEKETYNLLRSGRNWYGEKFEHVNIHNFSFSFPNIDYSSPVLLKADVIARSASLSTFTIAASNNSFNVSVGPTGFGYLGEFAMKGEGSFTFIPSSQNIQLGITYNKPTSGSIGWLNYLELNVRRQLKMSGKQMNFRDKKSVGGGNISEYQLAAAGPQLKIWDVTDPLNAVNQIFSISGSNAFFRVPADVLREFICFTGEEFLNPSFSGKVENQNIHGLSHTEMIIVSHPLFLNQAKELASFHKQRGLNVEVVTTSQVYNEFSSGAPDLASIRDMMKMFYDRATNQNQLPRYLLLFGDGSFDNKGKSTTNTNFILTYQSENSLSPVSSYVSDDFFGLLDDNEGGWISSNELLDIGIGRLPVKTVSEAQNVVKKIKSYHQPSTMRDWRNIVCFIADDEDGNLHLDQAESLANQHVRTKHKNYNIDKIYLDAYQQISTPGGNRYPEVNEAIDRRLERGALIVNYTGHGGEVGLAHERIISISQINNWQNNERLPLFVTATCEFSRFDDPSITSAGELVLLNPKGGGISLFSTVRLVYAGPNFELNKHFYNYAFEKINGRYPSLGDLFRLTKMASGGSTNSRNFTLLGDPAIQLAYPKHQVITSTIKGNDVKASADTLRALEKVTISGYIGDANGQKLSGYNGIVYPTVFDKESSVKTLQNDPGSSMREFQIQKNIIYRGKVSVKNGEFSFTFVVPKDIGYNYGNGRISYYAENGIEDAAGYFENFIIGGTAQNAIADNIGPKIDLFMNNDKFVYGGVTNENPKLIAKVEDESGINTVGSGIGHDIMAVLDENTDKAIVLNDYYEAELDSYQKGTVSYPFSDLPEGKHTLKLKVWDVYNNSSESFTEFVVANSAEIALKHVLNYPNPFTTNTEFHFEHNQPGQWLDVQVQVFTVSGKLIKTLQTSIISDGFKAEPIHWNGLDDFGDKIGRGVYIYRLKVRGNDGTVAEKIEKLVILN